ncbi:hypothetical protein D3C84_658240 [compost metagenome]
MVNGIAIEDEYFYFGYDFGEVITIQHVFKYCETTFGFSGDEWNEAKEDRDSGFLDDVLRKNKIDFFWID